MQVRAVHVKHIYIQEVKIKLGLNIVHSALIGVEMNVSNSTSEFQVP
jgi:hypothetical protein